MTCTEVFEGMEDKFTEFEVKDVHGVFQFNVHGRGGGQWHAVCKGASCRVREGIFPEPDLTFWASARNVVKLAEGRLNPALAYLTRKVKIKGNLGLAAKLHDMLADQI